MMRMKDNKEIAQELREAWIGYEATRLLASVHIDGPKRLTIDLAWLQDAVRLLEILAGENG